MNQSRTESPVFSGGIADLAEPHFHWLLPMTPDRPQYRHDLAARPPAPAYAAEVARAAAGSGFESLLLVTSHRWHDSWLVACAAAAASDRVKFIVAFRAGYALPTLVAQQIETFEALYPGRLMLNVVTGSNDDEQRAYGDVIAKAERYRRTDEFLQVLRAELDGRPFDFDGEFYEVRSPGRPAGPTPMPTLFFGGLSEEATPVGAAHADVQLMYGETPPMVAQHIERVSMAAARAGRTVEFGVRIQVIARDTSRQAWAVTDQILDSYDPVQIRRHQEQIAHRQSTGQARVQSLNPGVLDREALRPYPTMWSGLGLMGVGGQSTALVGSYAEVAERIQEFREVGVSHFLISGAPLLEEALAVGEGVLPYFRGKVDVA